MHAADLGHHARIARHRLRRRVARQPSPPHDVGRKKARRFAVHAYPPQVKSVAGTLNFRIANQIRYAEIALAACGSLIVENSMYRKSTRFCLHGSGLRKWQSRWYGW